MGLNLFKNMREVILACAWKMPSSHLSCDRTKPSVGSKSNWAKAPDQCAFSIIVSLYSTTVIFYFCRFVSVWSGDI